MTTKADFTDSEWEVLRRAPMVAGMAITLADPGGPIEVGKETAAVLRLVIQESVGRDDLVGEVAREVMELAGQRKSPLADFSAPGVDGRQGDSGRAGARERNRDRKATPEEAEAYRAWLLECAQRAANAAKEGGFMGFNAVRVSEGEERMLAELGSALGIDDSARPEVAPRRALAQIGGSFPRVRLLRPAPSLLSLPEVR